MNETKVTKVETSTDKEKVSLKTMTAKLNRKKTKKESGKVLNFLQEIAAAVIYPIAILPIAGLMNRLGVLFQDTTVFGEAAAEGEALWWFGVIIQKPGDVAFANLSMLFAISVAFHFAKDKRGEAAVVGFFAFAGFTLLTRGWTGSSQTYFMDQNGVEHIGDIKWNLSWMVYQDLIFTGGIADGIATGGFHPNPDTGIGYVPDTVDGLKVLTAYGTEGDTWASFMGLNTIDSGPFGGMVIGFSVAMLYNRYSDIQLPAALAFFSGRRFVPLAAIAMVIPMSILFAIIWPWIQFVLIAAGKGMADQAAVGAGLYAFLNRLLIPFGLHNATINPIMWFQLPTEFVFTMLDSSDVFTKDIADNIINNTSAYIDGGIDTNVLTVMINGDINAYMGASALIGNANNAGIENMFSLQTSAGTFQTGFFPVMMFGVPMMAMAAALNADKSERKMAFGMLGGAAAVSFLTGITEPIEFLFAFTAPMLYFAHAVLSGLISGITVATGMQLGFGFSAGLIDYAISIPTSLSLAQLSPDAMSGATSASMANFTGGTGWLWIIGPATAAIYFVVFYYGIQYFNVPTTGRTPYQGDKKIIRQPLAQWEYEPSAEDKKAAGMPKLSSLKKSDKKGSSKYEETAKKLSKVLEGQVTAIDNCATRLRLTVKDSKQLDLDGIKQLGFNNVVLLTKTKVQIIVGPDVEALAKDLSKVYTLVSDKTEAKVETKPIDKKEAKPTEKKEPKVAAKKPAAKKPTKK